MHSCVELSGSATCVAPTRIELKKEQLPFCRTSVGIFLQAKGPYGHKLGRVRGRSTLLPTRKPAMGSITGPAGDEYSLRAVPRQRTLHSRWPPYPRLSVRVLCAQRGA